MNERIKKLAEQAGYNIKELDVQEQMVAGKFAELIIDKCADIAWINTPDYEELEYSHLISNKIKEYFGVEE